MRDAGREKAIDVPSSRPAPRIPRPEAQGSASRQGTMSPKTTLHRHPQKTSVAPIDSLPKTDRWIDASLGEYRVSRIGRGGMGVVYQAHDPLLLRSVAIKLLPEDLYTDAEALRKFLGEARAAARISHPNVVAVFEADQEKGIPYLVMELMEGGSAGWLRAWGAFPWSEATRIIADACRGLIAVHSAGLVHRDIKPSNIMRTRMAPSKSPISGWHWWRLGQPMPAATWDTSLAHPTS